MIVVNDIELAHIKRTIRPTYWFTQATPWSGFLSPEWDRSVDIYPGMAMMKVEGDLLTLLDATGHPFGLAGLFVGGFGIDEVRATGVNAMTAWVLGGPDAEFEILAPAFDTSETWTDPADGTLALVHARTTTQGTADPDDFTGYRGQLVPAGVTNASARPIARLVQVVSDSKIVIAGLSGTV